MKTFARIARSLVRFISPGLHPLESEILTLIRDRKEIYGLDIFQEINRDFRLRGEPEIQYNSFTTALKALKRKRLVEAHFKDGDTTSSGARRAYYSVAKEFEVGDS